MQASLCLYIATEDTTSENAFAKLKEMKEILRSVKEILWPTDGREANVLDAVKFAVFRMARSDVFNAFHNVTRKSYGAESICNDIAVSADATKSDNVEGSDVEKKDGERLKIVLGEECYNTLNETFGVVGIDSKGRVVVGTLSDSFSSYVPNNGVCDVYINAATPISRILTIMRFNSYEKAICKAREENMSFQDGIKKAEKEISEVVEAATFSVIINETGNSKFHTCMRRRLSAFTDGTIFSKRIDDVEHEKEF